jgi:hypothetical protein
VGAGLHRDALSYLLMPLQLNLLIDLILDFIQVANFCSAEDDGSFWSRWIKPDAVTEAEVCISFAEFDLRFYRFDHLTFFFFNMTSEFQFNSFAIITAFI